MINISMNFKKLKKQIRQSFPKFIIKFLDSSYQSILILTAKFKINRILKNNLPIKLEIGAGDVLGANGWTTLDSSVKCDLTWDLRNGIPFPSNSISIIYSSHLFEHLRYNEIIALLKECNRVLKVGGTFSICVPNSRIFIEAYFNKDSSFWDSKKSFYNPAFYNTNSPMDWVNYVAYMHDEHKYMFDETNIVNILTSVDFKSSAIRAFDPTIDIPERQEDSLYAIAYK